MQALIKDVRYSILLRFCIVATIIGAIALLNNGCERYQESSEASLDVGVVLPLTGEVAPYGVDCRKGIELAFALMPFGEDYTVHSFFEDSKNEPRTAVSVSRKLMSVNSVDVIIGDMGSPTTLAIAPIAQEEGVVLLTPTAADPEIVRTGNRVFTIYPAADSEGSFMGKNLPLGEKGQVVVLRDNADVFKILAEGFASEVKSAGGNVSSSETFPADASGFRSLAAKVSRQNPTAIYLAGYKESIAKFLSAYREIEGGTPVYSQSTLLEADFAAKFADVMEGVVFTGPTFSENADDERMLKFIAEFKAEFKSEPTVWAAYGFDAGAIILKAFEQANGDAAKIASILPGMEFEGLTGRIKVNDDRTVDVEMALYEIKGGQIIRLR